MDRFRAALRTALSKGRAVLSYVRTHKAQVTTIAAVLVGLASRYVPELPADDILRTLATLLGAV